MLALDKKAKPKRTEKFSLTIEHFKDGSWRWRLQKGRSLAYGFVVHPMTQRELGKLTYSAPPPLASICAHLTYNIHMEKIRKQKKNVS